MSRAANAYQAIATGGDEIDAVTLWSGADGMVPQLDMPSNHPGLPSSHASLPLDAIHFVDSAQALSHVLTFLQEAAPQFVGIDLEWSDPQPVSVIQLATPHRAFVLDCVNRTPLYMSVLHCLIDWLLKREETTKLFFGFPHDLLRLNMLFEEQGKTFATADHIASVVDLYMQRVQRVAVGSPLPEDTPLGREDLLGDALGNEDLEAVRRLSSRVPFHPPPQHLAEQVFTVGGHHSLSSMAERYLGERLEKRFRASNWNFRPLAVAQVVYAAVYAHVLLRIEAAMRDRQILPQRVWGASPRTRGKSPPTWWLQ